MEIFTSRSRQEAIHECPFRGFLQYHYGGRGIQLKRRNIPLSTGSCVHAGLEKLGRFAKSKEGEVSEQDIDTAVEFALDAYRGLLDGTGFDLQKGLLEREQEFLAREQMALTEALIRGFASEILPSILKEYKILTVEREEVIRDFVSLVDSKVHFQSRIDWLIEHKEERHLELVSFKTKKYFTDRDARFYAHDTQGLSESYALMHRFVKQVEDLMLLQNLLANYLGPKPGTEESMQKINQFLVKKLEAQAYIMGVRMVYLIKGARKEESEGHWVTYSPLIRGYKRMSSPVQTEYAWAYTYPNPENKSGKGYLGRGWEPFNVWETKSGVKGWLRALKAGKIQPEAGDCLAQQFIMPMPIGRRDDHIERWKLQAQAEEKRWAVALERLAPSKDKPMGVMGESNLLSVFGRNPNSCHWPTDCPFVRVCWEDHGIDLEDEESPYEWRVPHHEAEHREHEKLYGIKGIGEEEGE